VKTINISNTGNVQKVELTTDDEYEIILEEAGAEVEIFGAFVLKNKDKKDVTVIIRHQAPHTRATTTIKGVVWDEASIRVVGRIIIDPECGDTNSFLSERILLLSDSARAEAVPDLEILTDDVKCSHAATISRIPDDQIFYLMSRGLSRQTAEEEIVSGFLEN
jgi:Fe-S cluster assembly protein SufD